MNSPAGTRSPGAERPAPLPADVSGFVGRHDELAWLDDTLGRARPGPRAGPGGVGKTRLALRAAARAHSAGGSCLVELSSLSDPELLPDTVALPLACPRVTAPGGGAGRADRAGRGELLAVARGRCRRACGPGGRAGAVRPRLSG